MAEISVLPVVPIHAGAAHILRLLTAAAEDGRDLGSRVPHMRVQARTLDHLVQKLDGYLRGVRHEIEARRLTSPEALAALKRLDQFVDEVRMLIDTVQAYSITASEERA